MVVLPRFELRQTEPKTVVLPLHHITPVIIKYPFWRMTAKNPNAFYACINQGQAICPPEIECSLSAFMQILALL